MVNNLRWCAVSLSEVVGRGKRIEASVYDVEAKNARETIEKGKYPVSSVGGEKGYCEAYTCGRFKRIWLKHSDYPIFQPSSITDVYPVPDGYLSRLTNTDFDKLRVHKGQILLTCSGTLGNISLVSDKLDNQIISHDLLRLTCKDVRDVGYVYTYLKSEIGKKLLVTNQYGAVISHIEAGHLKDVPIPDAPREIKDRIGNLINKSYELRDISNRLIDDATATLKKELQLPPIETFESMDDSGAYNVKLSSLHSRFDGSYHIPIVNRIVEHLKKYSKEVTTLGDERISSKIILAGIFKRTYVGKDYGYPFLGGKEICQLMPDTEKYLSTSVHKARYEKELKVEKNTILVTDRGTVGTTVMVPKHWNGYAVSQNVLKLVPASESIAGYIYAYLNSEVGKVLLTRQTYGSVVDMINDNNLAEVEIPLLKNKSAQEMINKLVLDANEKRYEAYCKEREALEILTNEVLCTE